MVFKSDYQIEIYFAQIFSIHNFFSGKFASGLASYVTYGHEEVDFLWLCTNELAQIRVLNDHESCSKELHIEWNDQTFQVLVVISGRKVDDHDVNRLALLPSDLARPVLHRKLKLCDRQRF